MLKNTKTSLKKNKKDKISNVLWQYNLIYLFFILKTNNETTVLSKKKKNIATNKKL